MFGRISGPLLQLPPQTQLLYNDTVQRTKRDGTSTSYPCPHLVSKYNWYMGGVDKNNQLHSYYHVRLKSRKHYKYIFWFLFDWSITNAYIHSQYLPEYRGKKLKDFRVTLAQELIGTYTNRKRIGQPAITVPSATRVCQLHFPTKPSGKYNQCHYCYKYKHKRRSTVWYCSDCGHHFCHTGHQDSDCFRKYHTRVFSGPTDN